MNGKNKWTGRKKTASLEMRKESKTIRQQKRRREESNHEGKSRKGETVGKLEGMGSDHKGR